MASGQTIDSFSMLHAEFPETNYGSPDENNSRRVVDLDEGDAVYFPGVWPEHYGGGGVTIDLGYAMSSASSGNVQLETSFERVNDGLDLSSDSFAAAQNTGAQAVPAGGPEELDVLTTTHTDGAQIDGLTAGDGYRLKVARSVISGAAGDLELLWIHVKET